MYKNNRLCNCDQCRVEEVNVIENGICKIKEGIEDIRNGLDLICCCRIREGIKCIQEGLCKVEKGLNDVIEALRDFEFECDYRSNMWIKAGVCDIKDGINRVKEGLCQLQNCCLCEGIESVCEGLKDLEEGLCNLVKGVNEIKGERERRRKDKCCELCPSMTYENKHDDFCGCIRTNY